MMIIMVLLDIKGIILLDFLSKEETINSAQNQETLKKLTRSIRRKRLGLQDNTL